jgi:hypothetical protein
MGGDGRMSECDANKDLVVVALKAYGSRDTKNLAECIESGRVHIGGCIPINERVNETLLKILGTLPSVSVEPSDVRKMYKKMTVAIKAGDLASKRYERCSREFNQDLEYAVKDINAETPIHRRPAEDDRLVDEIHRLKETLSRKEQRLDWIQSRR